MTAYIYPVSVLLHRGFIPLERAAGGYLAGNLPL